MALRSLLGGAGISVAAHELLLLTGDTFGVSGFVHRGVKGNADALTGVAGLVIGGALVAYIEQTAGGVPKLPSLNMSLERILLSGFLVGIGTKLANGCTSGHMICGISRLSLRSTVATATFFSMAAVAANTFYGNMAAPSSSALSSWNLSPNEGTLLLLQAIPLVALSALYFLIPKNKSSPPTHRALTYLVTSLQFAFALRLSDLTESKRVLGFLLLPFRKGFDPSLLFVAGSAVPLGVLLYKFVKSIGSKEKGAVACGSDVPTSESYTKTKNGIDGKVIGGSLIFGFGWGMTGICPGTGIVNMGRAVANGHTLSPYFMWTAAMVVGGLVAGQVS